MVGRSIFHVFIMNFTNDYIIPDVIKNYQDWCCLIAIAEKNYQSICVRFCQKNVLKLYKDTFEKILKVYGEGEYES